MTHVHFSTSQRRHDVSKEAVPTMRPDGWKATRERRPTWPSSVPRAFPSTDLSTGRDVVGRVRAAAHATESRRGGAAALAST